MFYKLIPSIYRILFTFILQGIIYMIVVSRFQAEVLGPLLDFLAKINFVFNVLMLPNFIYAVIVEILQRYINNYLLFGIINAALGLFCLILYAFLSANDSKLDAAGVVSFVVYFITYLIVAIYMKFLYNKKVKIIEEKEGK